METLTWTDLRTALRTQFKDARTDRNIQATVDKRKQKPNESFDEYHQVISAVGNHLFQPRTESYMLGEIQHELLHVSISTVAELRQAVRRHDIF